MLNTIIELSLNNRLVILFLSVAVMLGGVYTALNMEVDVFPDLTAPTVAVMVEAHGMATEEVERLVTFPMESALNGAPNLRRIRSSTARGFAIVWNEFDWGTDIYQARQIVTERLSTISERLPDDVGRPVLAPISSIMGEIMLISVTSDSIPPMELRTLADWNIRQQLLAVNGISQVVVTGGEYKQYQVLASPAKMKYYGITLGELEEAVRLSNDNASGGIISEYGNQYVIRGQGRSTSLKELSGSLIKRIDGVPLTIGDVAEISIGAAPKIGDASFMADDAIILSLLKQPKANTLELTNRIDATLANLRTTLPATVEINSHIFRQANFIQTAIANLQKTLLEGIFFICVVLIIFLMNWRTTIISLIAIPISLLVTIIVLKLLGMTINTMSLGGMAIAIGALVDDAIIDVENIYKRLRENSSKPADEKLSVLQIVFEASKEIRNSILIATLIIAVSFTPLFLLSGMEGRLLQPLGISFIVALMTSLFVAVSVTPVLSSYLLANEKRLRKQAKGSLVERTLARVYGSFLRSALRFPLLLIGLTMVSLGAAGWAISGLGRSFLPEFDEGSVLINVVCPPGISLEESNKAGLQVETILLAMDEISMVSRRTGRAELDEHAQGVNSSEIDAPFKLNGRDKDDFLRELRAKLGVVPGVNITVGQPIAHRIDHMLSGTRANIAMKIFGDDLNKLFSLGNQIKSQISGITGLVDVGVEQQIEVPQIRITPRRQILAKYGITVGELMDFVDVALAGEAISQVYEEQRSFDLVLRYADEERSRLEQIRNTLLDSDDGEKVPLSFVADVEVISSPFNISRENVQRKVVVSANVADRDLRGVVNDIQAAIAANIELPENYRIEYGGQFESEERASQLLLLASIAAVLIIFMLLYLEFRDLRLAGVVLVNLPLALIGGVFAVYFTSGIVSIASTIGFISLFGIATRNGILLISRYQVLLREGAGLYDTIMRGSLDRLNPIVMTALTTGLALIPLALAGNEAGNEIQSPMAIVILGGLTSATILNLLVIPALFWVMRGRGKRDVL